MNIKIQKIDSNDVYEIDQLQNSDKLNKILKE